MASYEKIFRNRRKRRNSLRSVIYALLYVTKSGCQWRMPYKEYPASQSVYHYFRKWKRDGTLGELHDALVAKARKAKGKKETPSVASWTARA